MAAESDRGPGINTHRPPFIHSLCDQPWTVEACYCCREVEETGEDGGGRRRGGGGRTVTQEFHRGARDPWARHLSTHSSLEAGLILLEGIASWLIHNQTMTFQPTPGSLVMENKQTTDTRGVITRSETVFGKFLLKQVHTCTARSIFLVFFY